MSAQLICSLRDCCNADWYHDFQDHRCPHDAWVESITVSEPSSGERHERRSLDIRVRLLGAYHDGIIEFTYHGVRRYSLEGSQQRGHGDWLSDKVETTDDDVLVHTVRLADGAVRIEAQDAEYKWTPLTERVTIP